MSFAAGLRESLLSRRSQVVTELARGDTLESILTKHLLAVEAMSERELITSILLLNHDATRLWHGAAPGLPQSFRDAIDGSRIGPSAGSCGTAAFCGQPIYVSDIATDPLWDDYRHLALPHGLRSCWSTPIRAQRAIVGTFAVYGREIALPTKAEIDAIGMIAEHVAQAITWARTLQDLNPAGQRATREPPRLKIVSSTEAEITAEGGKRLLDLASRLDSKIAALRELAERAAEPGAVETLRTIAVNSARLAAAIRQHVYSDREPRGRK